MSTNNKHSNQDAINIFDFDGTLTTETWPKFWVWVKKFGYSGEARNDQLEEALANYRMTHSGNHLETFFYFFHDLLKDNHTTITRHELMEGEKYIQYSLGLYDFLNNTLTHNYIVSGGLQEFLQNLQIADKFCGIYGTQVISNSSHEISGIGEIMTDDKKILAICDILKKYNRDINDCDNVFYIGDGYSDVPAMKYVHEHGGKAIFVVQSVHDCRILEENRMFYEKLQKENCIDCFCEADYSHGSSLFRVLERQKNL